MNPGQYNSSFSKAVTLLKKYNFIQMNNTSMKKPLSRDFIDNVDKPDDSAYKIAVDNYEFDLLFRDQSFLQFYHNDNFSVLRYAYFECPYKILTYEEFLEREGLDYADVGDKFLDYYDQFVEEAELKELFLTVRYDYNKNLYKAGVHPAAHFHIGKGNDVRISASLLITPLLFVMFILKQCYYPYWEILMQDSDFISEVKSSRASSGALDVSLFNALDKLELYLI